MKYSNLAKEEWQAIRYLGHNRNISIKRADKGSSVVVWNRRDYMDIVEKQLSDGNIQRKEEFKDKILIDLVDKSNRWLKNLKIKGCTCDRNLKYFTYEFKKSASLGKFYLLPEIQTRLFNVPGRPVTEKEFLDHHIKLIMQPGKSYIKDSEDFLSKIGNFTSIQQRWWDCIPVYLIQQV